PALAPEPSRSLASTAAKSLTALASWTIQRNGDLLRCSSASPFFVGRSCAGRETVMPVGEWSLEFRAGVLVAPVGDVSKADGAHSGDSAGDHETPPWEDEWIDLGGEA